VFSWALAKCWPLSISEPFVDGILTAYYTEYLVTKNTLGSNRASFYFLHWTQKSCV